MPAAEVVHAVRGHVGEELLLQRSHRRQRARCQHHSMRRCQHLQGSRPSSCTIREPCLKTPYKSAEYLPSGQSKGLYLSGSPHASLDMQSRPSAEMKAQVGAHLCEVGCSVQEQELQGASDCIYDHAAVCVCVVQRGC